MAKYIAREKIYTLLAVCAIAAGIVLTVYSVRVSPTKVTRLTRKLNDLRVVQVLVQQMRTQEKAVAVFEAECAARPVPLRDILQQVLPDVSADVRHRQSTPAVTGWVLQESEVVFNDVSLENVGRFIHTAENKRPPWILTEFNVVASEGESGRGRASLVLEALSREGESGS